MPQYKVILTKKVQKQLDKLSDNVTDSILLSLAGLEVNPRPGGLKKLKGRNGYRIRSGHYRIIYEIFDKQLIVEVIAIGNRKDVYS